MNFTNKRLFSILITIFILLVIFLYARNYYINGSSKENVRVTNIVRDYLHKKYPDKKFVLKLERFEFWYTIREFTISTEDEPRKEYGIITEKDRITMDEYSAAIERKK